MDGEGVDDLAVADEGEDLVDGVDLQPPLDHPALGGVRRRVGVAPVVGQALAERGAEVAQHLQTRRGTPGQLVVERHRQHSGLGEHRRAGDQVGFQDGEPGDQDVDVPAAQPGEGIDERGVPQPDPPLGMPGAEGLPVRAQLVGVGGDHADAQQVGLALGGCPGPLQALLQAPVDRHQVLPQLLPGGRQPHVAAVALEQLDADAALLLLDGLADPCGRHVQPLGGPPEVQFLRQRQKDLDVAQFHGFPPR